MVRRRRGSGRGGRRRQDWADLSKAYVDSGIALVLGSGASKDCGIPIWKELLVRIAQRCLFSQTREEEKARQQASRWFHEIQETLTWPAVTRLLEARSLDLPRSEIPEAARKEGLEFPYLVRQALYQDFVWEAADALGDWPQVDKSNHTQFWKRIKQKNRMLASIAALCAIRETRRGWSVNPRIKAIVTFNLDPILQGYVKARYARGLLRTVERPSAGSRSGKINVYHMHGMLRWDSQWCNMTKAAPDALVLTEQQYFDFFNRSTSLFNYTFLHVLREHPCLFVGLSMRDDNLRRLLHHSYTERVDSYLREKRSQRYAEEHSRRHFVIHKKSGEAGLTEDRAKSLLELGVHVLWVDDFADIESRLKRLYESVSDVTWADVY